MNIDACGALTGPPVCVKGSDVCVSAESGVKLRIFVQDVSFSVQITRLGFVQLQYRGPTAAVTAFQDHSDEITAIVTRCLADGTTYIDRQCNCAGTSSLVVY